MTAEPDPALTQCMLSRAGDLAHLMLARGQPVAVASGTTPNGHPCTVIYAIGWTAESAREIGRALCERVAEQQQQARQN
jgi:hypothetical protein